MKRRDVLNTLLVVPAISTMSVVHAHHGWSSFDQDRPVYLEGKVVKAV